MTRYVLALTLLSTPACALPLHRLELTPAEKAEGCWIVEEGAEPYPHRPSGLKETGTILIRCPNGKTKRYEAILEKEIAGR